MSNSEEKQEKKMPAPLKAGNFITCIWLLLISIYVIAKWEDVKNLAPNSFGDVLAGAFAPLAFLWLAIAVLLQRRELSLQREELVLARIEAKRSREALEKTSQHAQLQADLLRDQAKFNYENNKAVQFYKEIKNLCAFADQTLSYSRTGGNTIDGEWIITGIIRENEFDDLLDRQDYLGFLYKLESKLKQRLNECIEHSNTILTIQEKDFIFVVNRLENFCRNFDNDEYILVAVSKVIALMKGIKERVTFRKN